MAEEPAVVDPQQIELETRHVIAAYQHQAAQKDAENITLRALIAQQQEEIKGLRETIDAMAKAPPEHNGRVTVPKAKRRK